jgi:hypothetical protein
MDIGGDDHDVGDVVIILLPDVAAAERIASASPATIANISIELLRRNSRDPVALRLSDDDITVVDGTTVTGECPVAVVETAATGTLGTVVLLQPGVVAVTVAATTPVVVVGEDVCCGCCFIVTGDDDVVGVAAVTYTGHCD